MTDQLEQLTAEGEIATVLETALGDGPDAEAAKARLTVLGHAIVDQTGEDEIGDTMDRIIGLDPQHAKERHDALEAAWESVGREGDEHWV